MAWRCRRFSAGASRPPRRAHQLAFQLHDRQRTAPGGADHPADITEADLLLAFKPLLGEAAPAELLRYLENRAGLLIHHAEGLYAFPHRSFQEYLAACWLAGQLEPARAIRARAFEDPVGWREVVVLAIGKLVFLAVAWHPTPPTLTTLAGLGNPATGGGMLDLGQQKASRTPWESRHDHRSHLFRPFRDDG